MSEIAVHRVTSVEMKVERFDGPEPFNVHKIIVRNEDHEYVEIKLFTFDQQLRLDRYTRDETLDPRRGEEPIAENE